MKLVIINGSPAAGKTTLAEKLHTTLPMSLLADVDNWRRLISGWRDKREESLHLAYEFTLAAVDAYLQTGNDVIVDKAILSDDTVIDALIQSGKKHKAEIYEFIFTAERQVIIERAQQRGFNANSLLTPERVIELWEITQGLIHRRSQAVVIDTSTLTREEIYEKIKVLIL